jgi:non-canonical purine NTP pyrophosphatase (RdgB/HAM1 family)
MKEMVFITGNVAKAEQLGRHLHYPVRHLRLDLLELQSLDLEEIIEHKAREAFKQVNSPVLVEDVSLTFNVLGRLPGPLIKWFLTELGNKGLCRLLEGHKDRGATAKVVFGYYDGKNLSVFDAEMKGSIAKSPRGKRGFGWDPIFIPEGWNKTWAEMTTEEQAETSMRKIALKKLEDFLRSLKK